MMSCKMCNHEYLDYEIKSMQKDIKEHKDNFDIFKKEFTDYRKDDKKFREEIRGFMTNILVRNESFLTKKEAERKFTQKLEVRVAVWVLGWISIILAIIWAAKSFTS